MSLGIEEKLFLCHKVTKETWRKKAAYRNEFLDSYTIVSSTTLIHTNVWGPKHRLQEKYFNSLQNDPKYVIRQLIINTVYYVCTNTYVLITSTFSYITRARNTTKLNKYKSIFPLASLTEKDNSLICQRQGNGIFHTMLQC